MNLQFLIPLENGLLPTDSHFKVPLYTFVCVCTTLIYIKKETRKALQLLDFLEISMKKRPCSGLFVMAEDTGLEPAGLLHLTRFPGELLSHSVNPPGIVLR